MIKKESATPRLAKQPMSLCTRPSEDSSQCEREESGLSKIEFCNWAKQLATEERYLALRLHLPDIIETFRIHTRQFGESWRMEPNDMRKNSMRFSKSTLSIYQSFIDSIVLMNSSDYLDSLGFQFPYVESPDKIVDLLTSIKNISTKPALELPKQKTRKMISKSEWIHEAVDLIELELQKKMTVKWDSRILDQEKMQKKQLGIFWKNLPEEMKLHYLLLGNEDFSQLITFLSQMKIPVKHNELETEISEMLKMEKKDFCNRIFKWKLKRTSYSLCDYLGLFFNKLKGNSSLGIKSTNLRGKKGQVKRKRKNNPNKRLKSVDACSNETNQTQREQKVCKFEVDIQTVVQGKLQKDLMNCVDLISEQANSYFPSRVLAYERLHYILSLCGIGINLYGSCASGIAIRNSDIDAALDEQILEWFEYLPDTHSKINATFEMLESYFSEFKWISEIKKIPTAYIPIMKFYIDVETPFQLCGTDQDTIRYLNRPNIETSRIQIDLTIATTSQKSGLRHLGIISTKQTLRWMEEVPTLRNILIILKNKLNKKGLNETYYGGVNTYTLMVMIVAFVISEDLEKEVKISVVIERFLKFYGWDLDEKAYVIDLYSYFMKTKGQNPENTQKCGQIFRKKVTQQENSNSRTKVSDLQVTDPLNEGKIMTKNCYKFNQIKEIFQQIYQNSFLRSRKELQKFCSEWNVKENRKTHQELEKSVNNELRDNNFAWLVQ